MIFGRGRGATAPIAAEIHAYDRVIVGKLRRHVSPHQAGPRKAVHHKNWRSLTIAPYKDNVVAYLDFGCLELIGLGDRLSGSVSRQDRRRQGNARSRGDRAKQSATFVTHVPASGKVPPNR